MSNQFKLYQLNPQYCEFLHRNLKDHISLYQFSDNENITYCPKPSDHPWETYVGIIVKIKDGQSIFVPLLTDPSFANKNTPPFVLPVMKDKSYYGLVLINKSLPIYNDPAFVQEIDPESYPNKEEWVMLAKEVAMINEMGWGESIVALVEQYVAKWAEFYSNKTNV